jgi:NAD(P) transhydrogenase subunit alpha
VPDALVARMRPGSVIVDLAAEQGGNCEATVPDETVRRHGVWVMGPRNVPATVPVHASELYARNVAAFALPLVKDGALRLDWEDEIVRQSAVTHAGEVRHEPTAKLLGGADRPTKAAGAGG